MANTRDFTSLGVVASNATANAIIQMSLSARSV